MYCENVELGIVGMITASVVIIAFGWKIVEGIKEVKKLKKEFNKKKEK